MSKEVIRQLVNALKDLVELADAAMLDANKDGCEYNRNKELSDAMLAITAGEAELAKPDPEPVTWRYTDARGHYRYRGYKAGFDKEYSILKPELLYLHPAPKPEKV